MNNFDDIYFDKITHRYVLDGKTLTSVTSLISTLEPEVNWDEIAQKKADKEGISKDLLLSQWRAKSKDGMAKGSQVHHYIERRLKSNIEKSTKLSEMITWDSFWNEAKVSLTPVKIEWIVGDYDLGIGGTIDFLGFSERSQKYHILDWKTGDKFRYNNSFQNLVPPFDELENCEFTRYSLQLSAYKLILQRNTNLELGDSYIIRLINDEFFKVKAMDFSSRIDNWLLTKE